MKKYLIITFVLGVLVVHTDDNMVHFLDNSLRSHNLLGSSNVLGVNSFIDNLIINSSEFKNISFQKNGIYPAIKQKLVDKNLFLEVNKLITKSNNKLNFTDLNLTIKQNIDKVKITNNGYILFGTNKIRYDQLYYYPQCWNGLLIFCTIVNTPQIIENTFFLHTCVVVHIYDMTDNNERHLVFHLINTNHTKYCKYITDGRFLLIYNRSYTFKTNIIAIYEVLESKGIKYLISLNNIRLKSPLQNLLPPKSKINIHDISNFCLFGIILIGILIIIYYTRSVKYKQKISEICFYGLYFRRQCLVFLEIEKGWISAEKLKNTDFISVLFKGRYLFHNIKITELSYQFLFHSKNYYNNLNKIIEQNNFKNHNLTNYNKFYSDMTSLTNHLNISSKYLSRIKKLVIKDWIYKIVKIIKSLHIDGYVHGRICPENIRITPDGTLKIHDIFDNYGWQSSQYLKKSIYPNYKITIEDDLFSLGCIIHYYLTGYHPFNPKIKIYDKEDQIEYNEGFKINENYEDKTKIKQNKLIKLYNREIINEGIICKVLNLESIIIFNRNIKACIPNILVTDYIDQDFLNCALFKGIISLNHPFFWDWNKKIELICDFSDYISIDSNLHKNFLNKIKNKVFYGSWTNYIDPSFKFTYTRKYCSNSLIDLIRLIRNSYRHFMNLTNKDQFFSFEGGISQYFMITFPNLLICIYNYKFIQKIDIFKKYYKEIN